MSAKRYKYRTRDEGIFHQYDVEEIYDRYMNQASADDFFCKSLMIEGLGVTL